jgi:hypothetical protein
MILWIGTIAERKNGHLLCRGECLAMNESKTTPQTVFIHNRLYTSLGLIVGDEKVEVPVKGDKMDVIGAMLVYDKIPEGANKEEYTEGEVWPTNQ